MERGIRLAAPKAVVDLCPIADGGEGTVEALVMATGGEFKITRVIGPLGNLVDACWGMLGAISDAPQTAVIEMATASGLALVPPHQRDPRLTTTFGTGELIAAALEAGATQIIVGIGGSATNDGGCGAAAALGINFYDRSGKLMKQAMAGGMLAEIDRIDLAGLDPQVRQARLVVACDVSNPLTGLNGAAHIYGPQKGATKSQIEQLDYGLAHLADVIRRDVGKDIEMIAGAGAAGGLGGGLMALLGATLRPGIELVLDAVGFQNRVRKCDLCLTGEGRIDGQTLSGKACLGVASAANQECVKTIALVGSIGQGAQRTLEAGLSGYYCIGQGHSQAESIQHADQLIANTSEKVIKEILG